MTTTFTILGSGSSGNASHLEIDGFGLLIDAGLGPRQIATRFAATGGAWDRVDAVLLSHTHGDHWRETTLAQLVRREVPLYCHHEHVGRLRRWSDSFRQLEQAGQVRPYDGESAFLLADELIVRPFRLSHDDQPTFGFRIDRVRSLFNPAWAMAYAADLGTWDEGIVQFLADANLLALEFNHDPRMQRSSGRPPSLIARVLGDEGHLSNAQAASLLGAVVAASGPERLRNLVQLHLSRQCNRPRLAASAARDAFAAADVCAALSTASQHAPLRIHLED